MDGAALVGRERELGVLDEAIDRATRGERAVVMLVGEPGIGKTRLLDEVARRVATIGGRAAWGRTSELGLTAAYWPWLQILRALATTDDVAPQLAHVDSGADAGARLARFEDVVAFLARRAAAGLLALLLDDAHAADPSSLQLLEHLVGRVDGLRIVVAIATRDGDAPPANAAMLARIQRGARRLPLPRLGRDEVTTLVGERGDAARVWELSEGNPLFVEELVAAAVEGTSQLPRLSSVRAVIADRIARLPTATANVLGAAAVVGRGFRASVAAEIAGVPDHEIVARLAPAVRIGMVTPMTADQYRFSHALVAEVLADELEPSERARLHLRAAGILDRRAGDDASAIAHHLLAAGHLAAEAAVAAAERAAIVASAQLAFEDAAALLERALEALGLSAPGDRRRRVELACALAEALQHASQHERAVALCDEIAAVARDLDAELFTRVVLVRGLHYRYAYTDATLVALLREAVDRLGIAVDTGTVRALRARALARIAAAEQPAVDPQGPIATAREAIALSATLDDRDRLDVLWTATSALVEYAEPAELVPILDETMRLANVLGDRVRIVHSLLRQCFNTLDLVDRNAFDLQLDQLRTRVLALNVPRWIRALHLVDSLVASLEGRFADADAAIDAAIVAARGDEQGTWLIELHRVLSAPARGLSVTPEQRALLFAYTPARPAFAAWLAVLDRDVAETRDALAQIPPDSRATSDFLPLVAIAVAFAGTGEQAETMYQRLLPRRGRILVATMAGSTVMDLCDRILLVLATATQRWDDVDGHAADALAAARRLRSPVWAAWVEADWAD
ncbi:MAG: AAA family ATPase, partial [Myxococcota bacterium]|nr:AAA family ATPase [Myxococcota bacterium]